MSFKLHFGERHKERIRSHIHVLCDRGNITPEEYQNLRCNSWEFEEVHKHLTDEALLEVAEHFLSNCYFDQTRPWRSYNEAFMGQIGPLLVKALKRKVEG